MLSSRNSQPNQLKNATTIIGLLNINISLLGTSQSSITRCSFFHLSLELRTSSNSGFMSCLVQERQMESNNEYKKTQETLVSLIVHIKMRGLRKLVNLGTWWRLREREGGKCMPNHLIGAFCQLSWDSFFNFGQSSLVLGELLQNNRNISGLEKVLIGLVGLKRWRAGNDNSDVGDSRWMFAQLNSLRKIKIDLRLFVDSWRAFLSQFERITQSVWA